MAYPNLKVAIVDASLDHFEISYIIYDGPSVKEQIKNFSFSPPYFWGRKKTLFSLLFFGREIKTKLFIFTSAFWERKLKNQLNNVITLLQFILYKVFIA